MCSKLTRGVLCSFIAVGLVWLHEDLATAQRDCVRLTASLPIALERCVTAEQLCESYQRAISAESRDTDKSVAVQTLDVLLRAGAEANQTTVIEVTARTDGHLLGQRMLTVRMRDCAALSNALALVLVLLASEYEPAAAPTEVSPGLPPTPEQARDDELASAPPSEKKPRRPKLELGAGVGLFIGALPSAAPGLQLQAALLGELVGLRLTAAWLAPQSFGVAEGTVGLRNYELSLDACSDHQLGSRPRVTLALCAGPRLALIFGRGLGFELRNWESTALAAYVRVKPEVSLELADATWLRFGIGGAVALLRPEFAVSLDGGERWSTLGGPSWGRIDFDLNLVRLF